MPVTDGPPSHPDAGSHAGPPVGQWVPGYPAPQPSRSRTWPLVALVFATSRPSGSSGMPSLAAPTYSAAEASAAHQKLCDAYTLAARAVQIETNGNSPERAGIATVNGAVLLGRALSGTPALAASDRNTAAALADAYTDAAGEASLNDSVAWQSTIADVNAKDAGMKSYAASDDFLSARPR